MYGVPNLTDEFVSVGGHAYRADIRIATFQFLNKHVKRETTSRVEDCEKYTQLDGRKLRVFPTENDYPKDALNDRIDESFIAKADLTLPEKGEFAEWKKTIPAATVQNQSTKSWTVTTEPNIQTQVQLIQPGDKAKTATLIVGDEKELATLLPKGDVIALLTMRGQVEPWDSKSPPNTVARSLALLGRTVDEGRVWDIAAQAAWFKKANNVEKIRLIGKGQAGILAAYAALFEPSIDDVTIVDPPASHKDGPHFLNVLRTLDIPDALGLLAPKPITIIGGDKAAFARTAVIYGLADAESRLTRK
jgi:hypothetical protein